LGTRDGKPLTRSALAAYASARTSFTSDFSRYHNETTGVYFTLELDAGALGVDINYNRPTFFAAEAAEVLSVLCSDLELVVSDPQIGSKGQPFDGEAVLASYIAGNSRALGALAAVNVEQPALMARADALALWRYRQVKARLPDELVETRGEQYMVPDLVVVAQGGRALRLAFIPAPTYYVLPPVDLLMFKRGETTCVARAGDILSKIEEAFRPMSGYPGLRLTTEAALFDQMDVWDEALAEAPLAGSPGDLKRLALDAFVDE
jgi:hypothetical protein